MTSPDYPGYYHNNDHQTYNITVAEDKIIRIVFSFMKIENRRPCRDYIKLVDGDGTVLLRETCGVKALPPVTTSFTNKVKVIFHTDEAYAFQGWKLNWKEGKKTKYIYIYIYIYI